MVSEATRDINHDGQTLADFLRREEVIITSVEDKKSISYLFMPANDLSGPVTLARLVFDRSLGEPLPATEEEVARMHRIPGLVDAVDSLGRMLAKTKGDFFGDDFMAAEHAMAILELKYR